MTPAEVDQEALNYKFKIPLMAAKVHLIADTMTPAVNQKALNLKPKNHLIPGEVNLIGDLTVEKATSMNTGAEYEKALNLKVKSRLILAKGQSLRMTLTLGN